MSQLITHAYTLPFRVIDLQGFIEHLRKYVGVSAEILNNETNAVRLLADGGTWEVFEVVDGALSDSIIDLDDLVLGQMQPGEVAVYTWTRIDHHVIDSGIYVVNSDGQSHGDSLNSSAQRAVAALGAPEAASVVDYLADPEGRNII